MSTLANMGEVHFQFGRPDLQNRSRGGVFSKCKATAFSCKKSATSIELPLGTGFAPQPEGISSRLADGIPFKGPIPVALS
jgi:hypothetical protein